MGWTLEEMVESQVFVGIDVSKARLDPALRPAAESFNVANNKRGIATLVKRLQQLCVSRIMLEASGGYEIAVALRLGGSRSAGHSSQPTPGTVLCSRHGSTGGNRRTRRSSVGAFCRSHSAANSTAARCAHP
jgi:hypothetical protein